MRTLLGGLAFAVAAAFWPGFAMAGTTDKLLVVVVGAALMLAAVEIRATRAHAVFIAFLAWSALSLFWTPSVLDGINALAYWAALYAAFALGAALGAREATIGFAAGVGLSGALALAQSLGLVALAGAVPPAGFFGNKNYLAEAGLIALAGALAYRLWWAVPGAALAAFVPQSRAVIAAAAALALVWLWRRNRAGALAATAAVGAAAGGAIGGGLVDLATFWQRLDLWAQTLRGLVFAGHGAGSFFAAFPAFQSGASPAIYGWGGMPATAHNDALTLLLEAGIGGLLLVWLAWHAAMADDSGRWPFLAFLLCGVAAFPLYNPATGFMGAVLAGALSRRRAELRDRLRAGRGGLSQRLSDALGIGDRARAPAGGGDLSALCAHPRGERGLPAAAGGNSAQGRADRAQARAGASAGQSGAALLARDRSLEGRRQGAGRRSLHASAPRGAGLADDTGRRRVDRR